MPMPRENKPVHIVGGLIQILDNCLGVFYIEPDNVTIKTVMNIYML